MGMLSIRSDVPLRLECMDKLSQDHERNKLASLAGANLVRAQILGPITTGGRMMRKVLIFAGNMMLHCIGVRIVICRRDSVSTE